MRNRTEEGEPVHARAWDRSFSLGDVVAVEPHRVNRDDLTFLQTGGANNLQLDVGRDTELSLQKLFVFHSVLLAELTVVIVFEVGAPNLGHLHDLLKSALLLVGTATPSHWLVVTSSGLRPVWHIRRLRDVVLLVHVVLIAVLKIVILILVEVLPIIGDLVVVLSRSCHSHVLDRVAVHVEVVMPVEVKTGQLLMVVVSVVLHVVLLLLLVLGPLEVLVARDPVDSRVRLCSLAVGVLAIVHGLSSVSVFDVGIVVAKVRIAAERIQPVVLVRLFCTHLN